MAAQHQSAGRNDYNVTSKKRASIASGSYPKYNVSDYSNNFAAPHDSPDTTFEDSGYFESSPPQLNSYEDFQLYEDWPYVDEEASTMANHGSIYNGTNNEQTIIIPKYSSASSDHDARSGSSHSQTTASQQNSHTTYDTDRVPERPSLFGTYELVAGQTPLHDWAVTPHRHELNAYRLEQPQHPSDRPAPSTSSSPAKRRKTRPSKSHRKSSKH
ncbi:hypothetical protein BGZ60DRAFT_87866 [Tricladium varicosporioides]|nr:hypothetical protein BGZ60DRAFT_87866 [Hymenoscyphus varicosporioides]